MTDDELHHNITGLLAGALSAEAAEQFSVLLRSDAPLRERARQIALGILLAERSEQLDLLSNMDAWEAQIAPEQPSDTDIARIEQLLHERQDEADLLRNMDAWETEINAQTPPPEPFPLWRWIGAIVLSALLISALLTWICTSPPVGTEPPTPPPTQSTPPPPKTPTYQPVPPQPTPPPEKDQPAPQRSNEINNNRPAAKQQYIAMAESIYRQSEINTVNIRSGSPDSWNDVPRSAPPNRGKRSDSPFQTGIENTQSQQSASPSDPLIVLRRTALSEYENRRWPTAVRALDALLPRLPEAEKPGYLLLLGGAYFEQGDFSRAIAVFGQKGLRNDPVYASDAQRYELICRLANWPSEETALRQLIRTIRRDPDNPNRDLANDLLRRVPGLRE